MILLAIIEDIDTWIDNYANLNTFLGLLVGIVGIILAVYFYKNQKDSIRTTEETDATSEPEEPYLGVSINVDHVSRRMTGYGTSEGKVIQAGNFKANYEVEAELIVTIQNESLDALYQLEVSFTPNLYSQKYTLIDSRENKLQPLKGNEHFNFTLRIMNYYYDVYHQDVDKDIKKIYKVGKDTSLLSGSKIDIKYLDSKHKAHLKTEVVE